MKLKTVPTAAALWLRMIVADWLWRIGAIDRQTMLRCQVDYELGEWT